MIFLRELPKNFMSMRGVKGQAKTICIALPKAATLPIQARQSRHLMPKTSLIARQIYAIFMTLPDWLTGWITSTCWAIRFWPRMSLTILSMT